MSILFEKEIPLAPATRRLLRLGQFGYAGLLLLIPCWVLWLAPPAMGNPKVLLALLWAPLWLPLAGILQGKAYTFAWANFIVLIYLTHALVHLWISHGIEWWLAMAELCFGGMMFISCTYYARARGRELGLKIPKLKDDPIGS